MLLELLLAKKLKVEYFYVRVDSLLLIQQATGNFEVKEAQFVACKACLMQLLKHFKKITLEHIPRTSNCMVDALDVLGSSFIAVGETIQPLSVTEENFALEGYNDWYGDLIKFLAWNQLLGDIFKARELGRITSRHLLQRQLL